MSVESFEVLAESFYRETGFMAPGKDQPAAMGGPSYGERSDRWSAWLKSRNEVPPQPTGDTKP